MDTYDCIRTKLDIAEFASRPVPDDVKIKILEAARLTGSGVNRQHWRFILVQNPDRLKRLADDSSTGSWVEGANFAVIVLTDPSLGFHLLDAGRVIQDMELAAWNFGVVSRPFTGMKADDLRRDFAIPPELKPSVVVGFGYPSRRIIGRKSRESLDKLAFLDSYGRPLTSHLRQASG
jgi:nitroreductase